MTPDRSPRCHCAECGAILIDGPTRLSVEASPDPALVGGTIDLCDRCLSVGFPGWLRRREKAARRAAARS